MATAIQFLRSSTPRLRPNPADLASGMPMVNIAPEEPGLYFKTSDSKLFKVGPTFIGTVPPNDGATGFAGNTIGEQWLDVTDTAAPILKIWDGIAWLEVAGGTGDVQVQPNWNEVDPTDPSFIQNKPTVTGEFSNNGEGTNTGQYVTETGFANLTSGKTLAGANDPSSLAFIRAGDNTSELTNDGEDGTSPFLTEDQTANLLAGKNPDGTSPVGGDDPYLKDSQIPVRSVNGSTGTAGDGVVVLALNDINDVVAASPANDDVLSWNGTNWVTTAPITAPPAAELQGNADVASPIPGGGYTPAVGHIWVQAANPGPGPVTADNSWTGIGGQSVEDGAYLIYGDNGGSPQWFISNNVTAQQANTLDEVLKENNTSVEAIVLTTLGISANVGASTFNGLGIEATSGGVYASKIQGKGLGGSLLTNGLVIDFVDSINFDTTRGSTAQGIGGVGNISFDSSVSGSSINAVELITGNSVSGSQISGFGSLNLIGENNSQVSGAANIVGHVQSGNSISNYENIYGNSVGGSQINGYDQLIGTDSATGKIENFKLINGGHFISDEITDAAVGTYSTPSGNVMPLDIRKLPDLPTIRAVRTLIYELAVNNPGTGNVFYLNGNAQLAITDVIVGDTLVFDYSDDSNTGHPFAIYSDANKTTLVTAGVTNDTNAETLTFVPEADGTYYYECQTHAGMGGTITVGS